MSWLIAVLIGLVLVGGLAVFSRRQGRHRRKADETLVTDLLGPPPDGAAPPASQVQVEAEHPPLPQVRDKTEHPPLPQVRDKTEHPPLPQVRDKTEHPPGPGAPPEGEGDWLEAQMAWITAWSRRMQEEISSASQPEPDGPEPDRKQ